jgi:hypothetical protein
MGGAAGFAHHLSDVAGLGSCWSPGVDGAGHGGVNGACVACAGLFGVVREK